uniref:Uncharacterized protein n=1 Tax=Trichogramma kaykai TaxID=54128 RepID=A0ABD2WLJ4_9HYME
MCRSKSFTIIRYCPSLYLRYARRRRRRETERHDFSILHREYEVNSFNMKNWPHNVNNGRNRAAMAAVAAAASSETCICARARVTREEFHTATAQQQQSSHSERAERGSFLNAAARTRRTSMYAFATASSLAPAVSAVVSARIHNERVFHGPTGCATSWSLPLLLTRTSHVHEHREREDLEELELARRIDEYNCCCSTTRKIRENFIVLVLDATAWKSTGSTIAGAIHTYKPFIFVSIAIDVRARARLSRTIYLQGPKKHSVRYFRPNYYIGRRIETSNQFLTCYRQ